MKKDYAFYVFGWSRVAPYFSVASATCSSVQAQLNTKAEELNSKCEALISDLNAQRLCKVKNCSVTCFFMANGGRHFKDVAKEKRQEFADGIHDNIDLFIKAHQ